MAWAKPASSKPLKLSSLSHSSTSAVSLPVVSSSNSPIESHRVAPLCSPLPQSRRRNASRIGIGLMARCPSSLKNCFKRRHLPSQFSGLLNPLLKCSVCLFPLNCWRSFEVSMYQLPLLLCNFQLCLFFFFSLLLLVISWLMIYIFIHRGNMILLLS